MINQDDGELILLGSGGHASVLAALLKAIGGSVAGVIDPVRVSGSECFGWPILGDDNQLPGYSVDRYRLVNGIGSLPGKSLRWELAERMRQQGFSFVSLKHPTAIVNEDIHMAEGVQIMAGAIIQPGVELGRDCIVNTGTIIDHDCRIGDNCHLAPGVTLCGEVNVGRGAHLGPSATVVNGISIGTGAIVAAGSVVYKDVAPNARWIP